MHKKGKSVAPVYTDHAGTRGEQINISADRSDWFLKESIAISSKTCTVIYNHKSSACNLDHYKNGGQPVKQLVRVCSYLYGHICMVLAMSEVQYESL